MFKVFLDRIFVNMISLEGNASEAFPYFIQPIRVA